MAKTFEAHLEKKKFVECVWCGPNEFVPRNMGNDMISLAASVFIPTTANAKQAATLF